MFKLSAGFSNPFADIRKKYVFYFHYNLPVAVAMMMMIMMIRAQRRWASEDAFD